MRTPTMPFRFRLRVALPGAALVLALAACSDASDRPAPAAGGGGGVTSSSSSGGGGDPDAATTTDATSDAGETIGPELCVGLTQQSQEVAEVAMISAPPDAVGGAITPGLYVLNDMTFFTTGDTTQPDAPPPGPTGKLARATLVVTAKTMRLLSARGTDAAPLPNDVATAATYTVNGNKLARSGVCPSAGASELPYSASANLLTLHVDATHTEIYRLVPKP